MPSLRSSSKRFWTVERQRCSVAALLPAVPRNYHLDKWPVSANRVCAAFQTACRQDACDAGVVEVDQEWAPGRCLKDDIAVLYIIPDNAGGMNNSQLSTDVFHTPGIDDLVEHTPRRFNDPQALCPARPYISQMLADLPVWEQRSVACEGGPRELFRRYTKPSAGPSKSTAMIEGTFAFAIPSVWSA